MSLPLFLLPLLLNAQGSTPDVSARLRDLAAAQEKVGYSNPTEATRQGVRTLQSLRVMMDADELQSASDFLNASALLDRAPGFEPKLIAHEWAVSALVLGHPDAPARVRLTWDRIQLASGRPQRFGVMKRRNAEGTLVPRPTDPTLARLDPASGKDNPELLTLCEADQSDRKSNIDPDELDAHDTARRLRVLAILKEGKATTGADAYNAALVLQHGGEYADFMLAHELCLSAVARGFKDAVWLLSRTYDRMLENGGFPQRFGTQLTAEGKTMYILNVAAPGPSDTTRRLWGAESRASVRTKVDAWERSLGGGRL